MCACSAYTPAFAALVPLQPLLLLHSPVLLRTPYDALHHPPSSYITPTTPPGCGGMELQVLGQGQAAGGGQVFHEEPVMWHN